MPDALAATKSDLERALFTEPDLQAYAIVDGAQEFGLPNRLLQAGVRHECLFVGRLEPEMREVAPYLVGLDPESDADMAFFDDLVDKGWGKGWAIYLRSTSGMLDLRKHLRKLTLAEMPDGEVVFFRFYDPISLASVLPTMGPEQRFFFFGDGTVDAFFCESESGDALLRFAADDPVAS